MKKVLVTMALIFTSGSIFGFDLGDPANPLLGNYRTYDTNKESIFKEFPEVIFFSDNVILLDTNGDSDICPCHYAVSGSNIAVTMWEGSVILYWDFVIDKKQVILEEAATVWYSNQEPYMASKKENIYFVQFTIQEKKKN